MGLASSNGRGAMPRDMTFPVPKGCSWHDLYDYIRYAHVSMQHCGFIFIFGKLLQHHRKALKYFYCTMKHQQCHLELLFLRGPVYCVVLFYTMNFVSVLLEKLGYLISN